MSKRIKLRTLLFGGVMTLLFLVLIGRIYYVQVIDRDTYYAMAKNRWAAAETLTAKRGTITDRNGNVLAMDTIAYNVSVNPRLIDNLGIAEEVIKGLSESLGIPESAAREVVTAKNDEGVYFAHRELRNGGLQIEKALADKLAEFREELKTELIDKKLGADTGIMITETLKRYYPRKTLASQLVGYVSLDREKMTGVEAYFNDRLTGVDGFFRYEKDGARVQLAKGEVEFQQALDGSDITLTIDNEIQDYVEEAMREIVKKYQPKSATAIAADPNTGEILAMANMPEYDPNEYWKSPYENMYNHAVGSLYEPGSTFKIATLAAAVEEGLFNPEEDYKSGSYRVPGDTVVIRDHNLDGWGTISFLKGLKLSSNVAFIKLGLERLGAERLRDYFTRFGFGQKTGIELTNEATGSIRFQYNSEIAAASFGQGVAVTAIQQVAAVAAVANGGKLMEPHIIKSITDPNTKTTKVTEPKMVRRVISEQTSRQVGEYLEQVVSDQEIGTGKNAYIEGYRVAGKTGTAQKFINGKYSKEKFMVSFIGYAPVDNPKIVLYIAVDEPNSPNVGGGTVAAPAFREIVLKSLRKMGVAPNWVPHEDSETKEVKVKVPDMKDANISKAKAQLKAKAIPFEIVGNGGTVVAQIPAAGSLVHPTQRLYLITEQLDKIPVPDLTGVSLRDALELSSLIGAKLVTEGSGFVISQKVEEKNGERIIRVKLSPPIGSEDYVPPDPNDTDDSAGTDSGEGEGGDGSGDSAGSGGDDPPDTASGTPETIDIQHVGEN
ncbi:PASTA domain-containing protein [Paenibacillus pinisoli]|uniref:PASTA domain-containing protein n=1 Tax=Paenibacillus pinisoli TaxID=1276110 RepID=A0A3A6PP20_9BACL|nr:penicillin-binding transpeptidase domain-containing protein [Paenibacillus pinisoli]RJX41138.1 PASTA domain-containing protein [Paenibacillus pinisoli]